MGVLPGWLCRGRGEGGGEVNLGINLRINLRINVRTWSFCPPPLHHPPLGGRVALGRGRATPKASFFSYVSQSTHFGTIFSGPGPSEGCKCSQNRIGSFEIKVSQFSVFYDFSPLWDVPGIPLGALLVTVSDSGSFLGDFCHQNPFPGHPKHNPQACLPPK